MPFNRVGGDTETMEEAQFGGLAWPASMNANRFAVIACGFWDHGSGVTAATPTGFTKQGSDIALGGGNFLSIFHKACAGSESGTLTVNFSANTYGGWAFDVYDGDGDLTFASMSAADTGTGDDATAPSVSGTSGQGLVCAYAVNDPQGATNSGPSGMTIGSDATGITNGARLYYQALSSSGATGTKTWDYTTSRSWAGVSILIADAGAGGGGASALPILMNHYRQRRA